MKREWWVLTFVMLGATVLIWLFGCGGGGGGGGGGDNVAPLSWGTFGTHILPVTVHPAGAQRSIMGMGIPEDRIDAKRAATWPTRYMGMGGTREGASRSAPTGAVSRAAEAQQYVLKYPTRDDFERASKVGQWAVTNFFNLWWNAPDVKPHLLQFLDYCSEFGIKLLIRLEDQTKYSCYPGATGISEAWFVQEWRPYIEDVVRAGKGKVWGYQIWNESWEPGRYMLGRDGKIIQPSEYIEFLTATRSVIKGIDPDAYVLMTGLTSITEKRYANYTKSLQRADPPVESVSDFFNFHYYGREIENQQWVRMSRDRSTKPWIITECNHIEPGKSDTVKWAWIKSAHRAISINGKAPLATMGFCWNEDHFLPGWAMKDRMEKVILADPGFALSGSAGQDGGM